MSSEAGRHVKRNKILVATSVAFCILSFFLLVANFLGNDDNHHTNFRYLAWKSGRAPMDYHWCLHLAFVDADLHDTMRGKSIEQLRQWFPETEIPKPGSWQSDWIGSLTPEQGLSYQVIGESHVAIRFKNGKCVSMIPMKG